MPHTSDDIARLEKLANGFRKDILTMTHSAGCGHPGGSLSAIDMMTALYFHHMNIDGKKPLWEDRDRFVLSKGHASPALYACLAGAGYFDREELTGYRVLGRNLQGHPDMTQTPGVEISTGSLGQGLSAANGMAMGLRMDGKKARVYCIVSDAEMQEGQTWEAAMTSSHRKLDNLTVLIDHNGKQIDGNVEDIKGIEPLEDKWRAFGWNILSVDGHDMGQILDALEKAAAHKGQPTFIHAVTIKGKGVSFMEASKDGFHGVAPNDEQYATAMKELG